MIKKQVDWDVRVVPFTESAINPLPALKSGYPVEDNWELLSTEVAQVGGNQIYVMYTFSRYEYVIEENPLSAVTTALREEVRRGPGRPKKVEEVEPA